eukprot:2523313-Alexandrium_andersonii.AAC.1
MGGASCRACPTRKRAPFRQVRGLWPQAYVLRLACCGWSGIAWCLGMPIVMLSWIAWPRAGPNLSLCKKQG